MDTSITLGNFYLKKSHPEHPALIYHGQDISYQALDNQINQYAYYLLSLGIQPGDHIALSCYNTPEFLYCYFAVTKIGAVIVPLNLMLTLEEIKFILINSETKALIIHEKIAHKLNIPTNEWKKALGLKEILFLDDETREKIAYTPPADLPEISPDTISTLLYTSGTTGKPKGAILTHQNLLANAYSCEVAFEGNGDDKFLCVLPLFHTFGFTVCVLLPLLAGSTIVIHEAFHPKEVLESLLTQTITVFAAVPAMYVVLSQALKTAKVELPHLRVAVSGGAALPVEILKLFNDQYGIPLLEGYGLTEASPCVSFNPLSGVKKPGSVGIPLAGIQVRIIDATGVTLPLKEIGEIFVHGPNVMKGYYKDPAGTAETIEDGWLQTGDLGFLDDQGYLFIVDRKKELIITRGLNVYPREVEEALYAHPLVLEAAVIGVPDPTRGEIIKACVVLQENQSIEKKELLGFLNQRIASYKLPRIIEFVDHLPKNAAGKIAKKLLT